MSSNLTEKQLTLPLSADVLTGALTRREKAGFRFGAHIHTTIEFYRILSGFCYMDIGTETITCNTGDFIMVLPNVVHSFYLGKDSDCEFQQIHFRPETFANVILDNSGIYPISMMHAIHFHFKTYYQQKSDSVLDDCLQKVIHLARGSSRCKSCCCAHL